MTVNTWHVRKPQQRIRRHKKETNEKIKTKIYNKNKTWWWAGSIAEWGQRGLSESEYETVEITQYEWEKLNWYKNEQNLRNLWEWNKKNLTLVLMES